MSPALAADLQVACLLGLLAALYIPLGDYMARVFASDRDLGVERLIASTKPRTTESPTEWGVLEILARNPGRLVTQQEILRAVWGEGYQKETHYLRVYMAQLRRKLEDDSAAPRHLVTEPGRGYRLVP